MNCIDPDIPWLALEAHGVEVDVARLRKVLDDVFGSGGDLRVACTDGTFRVARWLTQPSTLEQSAGRDSMLFGLDLAGSDALGVFASTIALEWLGAWSGRATAHAATLPAADSAATSSAAAGRRAAVDAKHLAERAKEQSLRPSPFHATRSGKLLDLGALTGSARAMRTSVGGGE